MIVVKTRIKKDKRTYEPNSCLSQNVKDIVTSGVCFTDQPGKYNMGAHPGSSIFGGQSQYGISY